MFTYVSEYELYLQQQDEARAGKVSHNGADTRRQVTTTVHVFGLCEHGEGSHTGTGAAWGGSVQHPRQQNQCHNFSFSRQTQS